MFFEIIAMYAATIKSELLVEISSLYWLVTQGSCRLMTVQTLGTHKTNWGEIVWNALTYMNRLGLILLSTEKSLWRHHFWNQDLPCQLNLSSPCFEQQPAPRYSSCASGFIFTVWVIYSKITRLRKILLRFRTYLSVEKKLQSNSRRFRRVSWRFETRPTFFSKLSSPSRSATCSDSSNFNGCKVAKRFSQSNRISWMAAPAM